MEASPNIPIQSSLSYPRPFTPKDSLALVKKRIEYDERFRQASFSQQKVLWQSLMDETGLTGKYSLHRVKRRWFNCRKEFLLWKNRPAKPDGYVKRSPLDYYLLLDKFLGEKQTLRSSLPVTDKNLKTQDNECSSTTQPIACNELDEKGDCKLESELLKNSDCDFEVVEKLFNKQQKVIETFKRVKKFLERFNNVMIKPDNDEMIKTTDSMA